MPATFYPPTMPSGIHGSERKVWQALAQVSDDIVVFHSVWWQGSVWWRKRVGPGEADFVVLVPPLGILVLEVKGGGIELKEGTWYSTDKNGEVHTIKNPFEQAKDSTFILRKYFAQVQADSPNDGKKKLTERCFFTYGVVFPDIEVDRPISTYGPREIILDRCDLEHPMEAIRGIFSYIGKTSFCFSAEDFPLIKDYLAPTIKIPRLLRDDAQDADQELLELTKEQQNVLQSHRLNKQLVVLGGAGTGKTVLARALAADLAGMKYSTLLVCFNRPLQRYLASELKGLPVRVATFHGLVASEAKQAEIHLYPEQYESEAVQVLREAAQKNGSRYDAIVIDEGQDFAQEWLDVLQNVLLEQEGSFYLFADPLQDIYGRCWKIPEKGPALCNLTVNCRNTLPIARQVAALLGQASASKGAQGPAPVFKVVSSNEEFLCQVTDMVAHLASEGIQPRQMAILSNSAWVRDALLKNKTTDGIVVDTIHRGKGLEWDAVILALDDSWAEKLPALAYVGMSRAKSILCVVASPQTKKILQWDMPEPSEPLKNDTASLEDITLPDVQKTLLGQVPSVETLMAAAQQGDLETIKEQINRGVDVQATLPGGQTALMHAAAQGHVEVVRHLLGQGADGHAKDRWGRTALMVAAQEGHWKVVRTLLVRRGAKVNAQDNEGRTALMFAAYHGHAPVAALLLWLGAESNLKRSDGGTALMIASVYGHAEVVRLLLQHGADPDIQANDGYTALIIAAWNSRFEVAALLLEHKADIDTKAGNGRTALMFAARYGHAEMVGFLLERGAEVNASDKEGWTPLMAAAAYGHADAVDVLVMYGAAIDMKKTDSQSALLLAALRGHIDVIDVLLQHGADTHEHDDDGWTALIYAVIFGHAELSAFLLDHGAEINVEDTDGLTSLLHASARGNTPMVELLINRGSDVNQRHRDGWNALMIATQRGHFDVVESLLKHGADVHAQDQHGQTALTHAAAHSHDAIVGLLEAYGAF